MLHIIKTAIRTHAVSVAEASEEEAYIFLKFGTCIQRKSKLNI